MPYSDNAPFALQARHFYSFPGSQFAQRARTSFRAFKKSQLATSTVRGNQVLVVRPEQVRHANVVEKVARRDGVFLSYFVDPGKAVLWMQRSQAVRRKLGPAPHFRESQAYKPYPRISTRAQDPELGEPHA